MLYLGRVTSLCHLSGLCFIFLTPASWQIKKVILTLPSQSGRLSWTIFDDVATNDQLGMAGLLDPRLKTTYIDEDHVEVIKSLAIEEMESLSLTVAQPVAEPHSSTEPEPPKKKTLGSFFKKAQASFALTSVNLSCLLTCRLLMRTVNQIHCYGGRSMNKCSPIKDI